MTVQTNDVTIIMTVGFSNQSSADQVAIQFKDEGIVLGSSGTVNEIDFVGTGVQATRTGNKVIVTVSGGGGGGGWAVTGATNLTGSVEINGGADKDVVFNNVYDFNVNAVNDINLVAPNEANLKGVNAKLEGTSDATVKSDIQITLYAPLVVAPDPTNDNNVDTKGARNAAIVSALATEKDATGGIVGLTLFKINFKNALNTFTSFLTNDNTAARTYTFPDSSGTMLLTAMVSGGATMTAAGVLTIANTYVTNAMLAGSIDLTAKVTGVLPIANGGTGSATKNFVDLTTSQTVAGGKTFSNQLNLTTTSTDAGLSFNSYAGDPSGASNGNMWFNSSTGQLKIYVNGASSGTVAWIVPAQVVNTRLPFLSGTGGGMATSGNLSFNNSNNTLSATVFSGTSATFSSFITVGNSTTALAYTGYDFSESFTPTTGTAAFKGFYIHPTYNTTGSYSGTATGFDYDPTLTSTTGLTHYAFRHTSGFVAWQSVLTPAQITSNQNDYNPTGWNNGGAPAGASILRLSTDASRNLTSLTGGVSGRLLLIANVGSFDLVIKKDDGSTGTIANRFALNADITLLPEQSLMFWYDGTSSRWRANKN